MIANAPRSAGSLEPPTPNEDSLPSFADLTNDEERERRAEGHRPGTYTVIVNQESFSSMPEYASPPDTGRRMSVQSLHSSMDSSCSESSRAIACQDPNTVVLTRFEDAVPSLPSFFASTTDRKTSLPGDMQRLDLSTSLSSSPPLRPDPNAQIMGDTQLVQHYAQKISPRILSVSRHNHDSNVEDPIVAESRRFPPVRSEIRQAVSLRRYADPSLAASCHLRTKSHVSTSQWSRPTTRRVGKDRPDDGTPFAKCTIDGI